MTEDGSRKERTAGRRRRPSHTATRVARGVLYVARDQAHAQLLPKGAADSTERLTLGAGVVRPWMVRLFERPWYRRIVDWLVGKMGPGELMRLTLRKRFVDDEIRAAIGDGAKQVLIVGAGFDTAGLRTAEAFPDVVVVELDTAATIARKREAIDRMGERRTNHHLVAADLARTSLAHVLRTVPDWREDIRSVAVAEGVIMYLDETEVAVFLGAIRDNTGPGSRLVFTYVMADDQGRPYLGPLSGFIRTSLKLIGEPLRWAVREGELVALLERTGFQLADEPERFDMQGRYLVPLGIDRPVGQMERFAVAEVVDQAEPVDRVSSGEPTSARGPTS